MKRTIEIDSWGSDDLVFSAGEAGEDSCTVAQLVEFLLQQSRRPEVTELENVRLTIEYGNDYDVSWLALVGDREETDEERQQREAAAAKAERRVLLDYVAEHHRPQLRNESEKHWRDDCAALIHQKGWDKLEMDELRKLARQVSA